MSKFTGKLQYQPEGDLYRITSTVRFYWRDDCTGEYVELNPGHLTNFASIPKLAQIIFKPDHEDVKMTSAFHDAMVGEFDIWSPIQKDGDHVRWPTWAESAKWFRRGMQVRQRQTRKGLPYFLRVLMGAWDFVKRWVFWALVRVHGFLKGGDK